MPAKAKLHRAVDRTWMQLLMEFSEDWNRTFRTVHTRYCSQQYWHLFTTATKAHLDDEPLTFGQALHAMPSASNKTREGLIIVAIRDGLLEGREHPKDKRKKLVVPSDRLLDLLAEHLAHTREAAVLAINARHVEATVERKSQQS
jgi:hypothetical protein